MTLLRADRENERVIASAASTESGDAAQPDEIPPPQKRRRWWLVVSASLVAALLLFIAVGALLLWRAESRYSDNLGRLGNPFSGIPENERPARSDGAMNILLLGSDSRISAGDPTQWEVGAQRTDTIMIAHVPADRSAAYIVSIPRDSWVPIPGRGTRKINAAFSFGGPGLLVRTTESLTGVRIEHVATMYFTGFFSMTDALGGVDVPTPDGVVHMNGEEALVYVRERKTLPGGDFDRIKRQQNFLRAMAQKLLQTGALSNPVRLDNFLDALTRSMAVDDDFEVSDMRSLALGLRDLGSDDIRWMTVPLSGTGRSDDGQSIVLLDEAAGAELWQAMRSGAMAEYVAEHPSSLLKETVR